MQVLQVMLKCSRRVVPAAVLALTAACSGTVPNPYSERSGEKPGPGEGQGGTTGSGGSTSLPPGGSSSAGTAGTGGPVSCAGPSPGTAPLRRLSNAEYRNTVRDLFGDLPGIEELVAAATSEFPAEPESLGFRNSAQFLTVQALGGEKYLAAAEQLAEAAADVPELVSCSPEAGEEMTCARTFIREFGERSYRRPLTDEEVGRYADQFETALADYDFKTGVEWTIFSMLQSPAFLYRVERGQPSAGATTRPTAHETASRLSYLFWQSQPDAKLLRAAADGELETAEDIAEKAREMLKDPRAERLVQYFDEWLDLDRLDDFSRDPAIFPDLPEALPELYRQESKHFVLSLLGRGDGRLVELLTAPYTYANETLADFYGLSGPSGSSFVKVDDPRRSGILTQGMLAAQDKPYRTSIVRRGLKLRTDLLCQTVPAPPNDVELNLDSIAAGLSQRERLAQHREDPACGGCHALLDPLGVVFENFDAVGRYRTRDEDGEPIVTESEIVETRDANGTVTNVRELGELLANSSEVKDCYVTQSFRFFFGRELEAADECSLAPLRKRFADGELSLSELLVAFTQTDAFLYRPTLEVTQ